MADTGVFATTAEVQYKATVWASTVSNTETYINSFMTQAESYINAVCCINFSDLYTTLNVDVKGLLKQAASCLAAIDVINYDTTGFPSSRAAETALDVLSDKAEKAIAQLKEKSVINFIKNPTT